MDKLIRFPETSKTFLPEGFPPKPFYYTSFADEKTPFIQKGLAKTLRKIAAEGIDAFYRGEIAEVIAEDMFENDGLITLEDLANYPKPQILEADYSTYREHQLFFAPGSLTGPLILNVLEGFDLSKLGHNTPGSLHLIAEAIGIGKAVSEKLTYLPSAPLKKLKSKGYAEELRGKIDREKAIEIEVSKNSQAKSTTHFCIIDNDSNMVSMTQSIGHLFGSSVVIPKTGIVMNNEMHEFNPKPGTARSIKPGLMRWLEPNYVLLRDGAPFMAVGSPGNSICAVIQVILNVIDYGMNIQQAIDAPRIYRSGDEFLVDSRISSQVCRLLKPMGHNPNFTDKEVNVFGLPNGIVKNPKEEVLHGGTDRSLPYGINSAVAGY